MERDQVLMTLFSTWIQQNPKPDTPLLTQIRAVSFSLLEAAEDLKEF